MTVQDAITSLKLTEDDDVLNEVSWAPFFILHVFTRFSKIVLDSGKKHLAFSTDLGVIGVVELSSQSISKMKEKHTNVGTDSSGVAVVLIGTGIQICACVKFIPDRPREIVSAGYDETFLHFDFLEGDILSQCKISVYANQEISSSSRSPLQALHPWKEEYRSLPHSSCRQHSPRLVFLRLGPQMVVSG